MRMHVDQIIFPKFQGKYEKIKIKYIYIYIYIYIFLNSHNRKICEKQSSKIPYFFTHEFPLKIFVKIVKPQLLTVVLWLF